MHTDIVCMGLEESGTVCIISIDTEVILNLYITLPRSCGNQVLLAMYLDNWSGKHLTMSAGYTCDYSYDNNHIYI